jgi:calpain-15
MLMEKAYAKAFGSYNVIAAGWPKDALRDLTGAPSEEFDHK